MTSSKLADFGLSECSTSIVLRQPCFKSATHVLKIINEGADSPCVASSSVLISDGNKPFKKKKKKFYHSSYFSFLLTQTQEKNILKQHSIKIIKHKCFEIFQSKTAV